MWAKDLYLLFTSELKCVRRGNVEKIKSVKLLIFLFLYMGKVNWSSYFFGIISFNKKCGKFFWRTLLSDISLNILGGYSGNFIFSFRSQNVAPHPRINNKREYRLLIFHKLELKKAFDSKEHFLFIFVVGEHNRLV